jgi:hypothetical protein
LHAIPWLRRKGLLASTNPWFVELLEGLSATKHPAPARRQSTSFPSTTGASPTTGPGRIGRGVAGPTGHAGNYYWERDGHIPALDAGEATTSGLLQEHLPQSKVAKAFNHILYSQITKDGTPAGTPNRRALATASDFPEAAELVTRLYDEFGFDTVNMGPLSESWRTERDRPAYVIRQNAAELAENLAKAPRTI